MAGMTGGKALVEALKREKTTHLFGLIGSSTMEIYDALYDTPEIKYVSVRHEANAVHMADAYGRVSGNPGVVLAGQNGPGATNLVTGFAQALLAYSPVVAIAGLPATGHIDKGGFQEVDQQALFTAVTKKNLTVRQPGRIPEYIRDAFHTASSGRRGPVMLNIPRDMFAAEVNPAFPEPEQHRVVPAAADPAAIEGAAAMLRAARRPLIYAGAGVKWARASQVLMQLAERLQIPVVASAGHGDVLPWDFELYAGQAGPRGNWVATQLAREADVILALGTRLGFNSTMFGYDYLSKDAQIIQVDIEPTAVGRYFPVAMGVVADAGQAARGLLAASGDPSASRTEWIRTFMGNKELLQEQREAAAADAATPLKPAPLFAALNKVLPDNAIVTLDAGTMCLQATDLLRFRQSPSLLTPLDFGLVGFSYAAGIGAKAAAPDRPVISLMGDGGFGMSLGEIGTTMQNGLHTICIVMNNGCWGAEKAYQRDFYNQRYLGADTYNPRFDLVAQAFGSRGVYVETVDQIGPAVEDALNALTSTIIEVPVDPDAIISFRRDSFKHRAGAKS